MHTKCRLDSMKVMWDGRCLLTLEADINPKDAEEQSRKFKDKELILDLKEFKKQRSLSANAYAWQLFDKIAKKLKSDKWTIYLLQLSKYGVFADLKVRSDALATLRDKFRYTEVLKEFEADGDKFYEVRVYFGSSTYNSQEMSELLDGTVQEAKDLGIDVLTPDEIAHMVSAWKGGTDAE